MRTDDQQNGDTPAEQNHFVPALSALQLFREGHVKGEAPWAEWFSLERPDGRKGLWETIEELAETDEFSMVLTARSNDLSHHSWYAHPFPANVTTPPPRAQVRRDLESGALRKFFSV